MIGQSQPEAGRRLSGHPINDKLVMAVNFASTDPIVTLAGVPKIPGGHRHRGARLLRQWKRDVYAGPQPIWAVGGIQRGGAK